MTEVKDDEQPPAFEQVEEEGEEPSRQVVGRSDSAAVPSSWDRTHFSRIPSGCACPTSSRVLEDGLPGCSRASGDSPDDPKYDLYAKRLQRVRRIREYPYVMHVLERSLYEEVAEIFVRVELVGG